MAATDRIDPPARVLLLPSVILGIGLGGFFDGIMLHQVLQWHHLLSLVPGEALRDPANQILADGLFHVLMYVITAWGLVLLWRRARRAEGSGLSGRTVLGGAVLGFGIWNLIDVGFFHWILVIHRIRVGVPNPMAYDLGWLGVLGFIPMVAGWAILRNGRNSDGGGNGRRAAAMLGLLALVSAPIAALPPRGVTTALVLFAPGSSPATAMNAAVGAQTPILWIDPKGRMMAVSLDSEGASERLRDAGALLVTRSPAIAGCAAGLAA